MRYSTYETIIRQVSSDDIKDVKVIFEVISSLFQQEVKCCLLLKNGSRFAKVKLLKVDEEKFTYLVVSNQSNLKKTSLFSEIESIEVNNINSDLLIMDTHVDRWSLLDHVNFNQNPAT